jgi:uncharacterized protein YjbI with pentapeptide repeats
MIESTLKDKNQNNKNLSNSNLIDQRLNHYNFTNANFSNSNLSGCSFIQSNLTNVIFKNVNLSHTNFTNAILDGTIFINSDLNFSRLQGKNISENTDFTDANLTNADLSNTDFSNATFTRANFSGADLAGANFTFAKLTNVNLRETNLSNLNFSKSDLTNADLSSTNLTQVNFSDANLTNSKLINAKLNKTYFLNTNLSGANLDGAKFINVRLTSSTLIDAKITEFTIFKNVNLSESTLTNTNLSEATYTKVNFTEADLTNCVIIDTQMIGTKFQNANLSESELTGNDFTNANFTNADLSDANLSGSNLTNANFTNAFLRNTNFVGTNITNANFTNAREYAPGAAIPTARRVNPHEIHQEMVKVLNNLPRIFQIMNPNNETIPILNTSLLINNKLDSLVNNLQPTTNYDTEFLTKLKQNVEQVKQIINGFGDFTNTTFKEAYRDYTKDIQNKTMKINLLISYPLFFIEKLTPDTICYYLDDWATGSLTAYDNAVSCAKGICERFIMSVAAALQIYFDENTHDNSTLKTNYGEIISLILNKEFNPTIHYLDVSQFKTMILDKCFQEWYGEHTFDEISHENQETELQKFKDCVKLKYDAQPEKLNPSENYEDLINNYIDTIVKITKGGNKRKTCKKRKVGRNKKTCKKKKVGRNKKTCKKKKVGRNK